MAITSRLSQTQFTAAMDDSIEAHPALEAGSGDALFTETDGVPYLAGCAPWRTRCCRAGRATDGPPRSVPDGAVRRECMVRPWSKRMPGNAAPGQPGWNSQV